MSAVGRAIEADLSNPAVNDPRVLPGGKVRRGMHSAWKQKCIVMQVCGLDPLADRLTRQVSDLELNRPLGLLLHDHRSRCDLATVGHDENAKLYEITGTGLGIDRQIEQRQVADPTPQLQTNADRPDVAQLQWCLLANELALVPWLSLLAFHRSLQSGPRWSARLDKKTPAHKTSALMMCA